MEDYGTSTCPKADEYIDDHKLAWKEQAERSKTEDNDTEGGDLDEDRHMSEEINVLETRQMENLATKADYHESCRLFYATPSAEYAQRRLAERRSAGLSPDKLHLDERRYYTDPILIRAEYIRMYDQLMYLHRRGSKAVVTGQPGIGNLPCTVSYVVNMANQHLRQDSVHGLPPVATRVQRDAGIVQVHIRRTQVHFV
jgi:hypothetical protein